MGKERGHREVGTNRVGQGTRLGRVAGTRTSTMDLYSRNTRSNFNTTLHMLLGGELWARLLLCLGYTNHDVVDAVHAVIAERVRESAMEPAPLRGRDSAAPPRASHKQPPRPSSGAKLPSWRRACCRNTGSNGGGQKRKVAQIPVAGRGVALTR